MRIAVCTPWSRQSAVARSSRALAEGLAASAEVVVAYPDVDDPLPTGLPTVPGLHPARHATLLDSCDHVLYAIGDHSWHELVRQTAAAHPGVVVLHDLSLANLAWSASAPAHGPEGWLALTEAWHGPAAATHAKALLDQTPPWRRPVDPVTFHFRRWALQRATGVLVHSDWAVDLVAGELGGTACVTAIPLAYPLVPPTTRTTGRRDDLIVVAGSLHPHRQGELIIDAMARLAQCTGADLVFMGGGASARIDELATRAREAGIGDRVSFIGSVDDQRFRSVLEEATVVVNLRRPVLQSGSATVLEQLAAGATVIVLDEGPFAELPDDVALKVHTLDSDDLASQLLLVLGDAELRRRLAAGAARFLAERHDPATIARAVLVHLDDVERRRPLRDLSAQLATVLRPLVATAADPLARRIGAAADELFAATLDGPPVPVPPPGDN